MTATQSQSKIQMIREQMPAVTKYAYLNTGTFGPLPRVTVEAISGYLNQEMEQGRISDKAGYRQGAEAKASAREEMSKVFNCAAENVVLTRHTTDGMNIGILGLNWHAGDELIITSMEHPGGQVPAYLVGHRYGVTVRTANLGDGSGDVVGKLERLINPRTRMIVTSHLTWNTGAILPLKEIVEMAHRHHLLVVVDGAQSTGSIPLNVEQLGVDVYAGPGQKWLCGPEGTGATYVSNEAMEQLQPTVAGYMSGRLEHRGGFFLPHHGAMRYEVGGSFSPAILGQATSVHFIRETVGLDWVYERISQLGKYCWKSLAALNGVNVLTPMECMAGLVTFTVDGIEPNDLVKRLAEREVVIRSIHDPDATRVSTGFYNTEEDIDHLAAGIKAIQQEEKGQGRA
ncbi:MAG TPA: aminotransferase class V-fold PLP-dependent enzyme [Thermomicrobiaceae bacterium]|nr:aminotransferase class V-fold PLP-dependent enzyme [Thermomicrobiaceae bacterium]